MRVRPWLLVVAWFSLALLVAAVAWFGVGPKLREADRRKSRDDAAAARQRAQRRSPIVEVPLAPLPDKLPLIGDRSARGPDGYPVAYVDRPGLRSLLARRRFPELTAYVTELQDAFEADPTCEAWANDGVELSTRPTPGSASSSMRGSRPLRGRSRRSQLAGFTGSRSGSPLAAAAR